MTNMLAFRRHILRKAKLLAGALTLAALATTGWARQPTPLPLDEEAEEELLQLDLSYTSRRTAGTVPYDLSTAGQLRGKAAKAAKKLKKEHIPSGPTTFDGAWSQIGPNPIVQGLRTPAAQRFGAMSGRIGALAIRKDGTLILGAAQGGIWVYQGIPGTGTWSPKTDDQTTQSIGALAVAPSNDMVVYAGTGEGALSGDSYFGDGVLKSTDGGATWNTISGDQFFRGVSISRIVVDPTDPNHVYAASLRGRGGARRVSPPASDTFGVWESKDGGVNWKLLLNANKQLGATDLEMDPQNPQILYASVWGDAIYKSTDGGKNWTPAMHGLPVADYTAGPTRFSIAISHPSPGGTGTLYAGFDYTDATGYHKSRVWKSTDGAASWSILPAGTSATESVEDYCGSQCFYDNVIEADPTNANVVYAAGQFNYNIGSGGVFRSDDGGQTWRNLGYDQHPDFHAFAFNPNNTAQVLIGSDGGVWYSASRGGRTNAADPLSAVTWVSLNGSVDPSTAAVTGRSNLSIAQFTSIGIAAQVPRGGDGERFWGGTQDNGTIRKSVNSKSWFDFASGDGGQVLIDPTADSCNSGRSCFVYGTYFGVSPYRFNDGGNFYTNSYIRNGLNTDDRSDFYIPFVLNRENPEQLFLGTFRLYRTDNARAPSAGDVKWTMISGDLTTGCPGTAPNGARNCTISAIGIGGGQGVYTGSLDGLIYVSPDAQVNDNPTWTLSNDKSLPARPVAAFAVDRSNYRIAYVAFNGFNGATPKQPGHVFRSLDGGKSWTDVSGDLPDTPVNSVILDPSYPNTLYVGTDVGPFVSYNGGTGWSPLGTAFPLVAVDQLDFASSLRLLAAGTHGRGAFKLADTLAPVPALVLLLADDGKPVGPSSQFTYTFVVKNEGNAAANNVTITDPVPQNTSFVSADAGGTVNGTGKKQDKNQTVTWVVPTIAAGGNAVVHLTVQIDASLKKKVTSITNDGIVAQTSDGFYTTGSPVITPIASPFAVSLSPATQTAGGRVGKSASFTVTIENDGYTADKYSLSAVSAWATTFYDASCTTLLTTTPVIAGGGSLDVCAKVAVPGGTADKTANTSTVTATSVGSPGVSATATLNTIAVGFDTLLVDNDDNNPDVQGIYAAALTAAGVTFTTWDLKADPNLPPHYVTAFKNVVWFTGNSYPAPIVPYEATLKEFLDNGGRLLMSGQDILDQAAGTTTFVHDYLHISWDGSERQNDQATANVHGVSGNPVSNGIGTIPLDHSVLNAFFEDQITPINGATPAFTDDTTAPNALTFSGAYKVVFLGFPLEAYGTAGDKAALITRVFGFFGP